MNSFLWKARKYSTKNNKLQRGAEYEADQRRKSPGNL